jgi:hypothetical protein
MWWNLKIVRPEPQPNKNTKVEDNKQKPIRITSAGTDADSDKMMKLTTSSHHIAKPPVVRSPFLLGHLQCGSVSNRRVLPVRWHKAGSLQGWLCVWVLCALQCA